MFVALKRERADERARKESVEEAWCLCVCWSGGVFKRPKDGMKGWKEQVQRWMG